MEKNNPFHLPLLVYDGECVLCLRFAQSLDRVENAKSICKVPYQNEELYHFYPQLKREDCENHPHLILETGDVLVGEMVVDHLIRLYPAVKTFSWLLDKEMGRKSVELFYTAASRLRKNLKKACPKCGK